MADSLVDVALLAYGGPTNAAEIPGFLGRVGGHEPDVRTVAEITERYRRIGGASPLPAITARQSRALQARLVQELAFPLRVRHGFLYSEPTVADCLAELDAHEVLALPLCPFASRLTTGRYRAAIDVAEGLPAAGPGRVATAASSSSAHAGRGREIPLLEGWYADRGFVRAVSRRAAAALDGCDINEWAVLFTAQNVPLETVTEGDPYVEQLQQTIAQLVPALMPGDWKFGFQTRGHSSGDWMEPEVEDVARSLAEEGWKKVLVIPVGSVSDDLETLFGLDVLLREEVESLGMEYRRAEPPNDSPLFIEGLADAVIDYLARRPLEHALHRPDGPHVHG